MIKTKNAVNGERSAGARNAVLSGIAAICRKGACRTLASLVLAISAVALLLAVPIAVAQDSKTPAVLPAPSSGKAIVCIYRTYRFTGSASHDNLYINGAPLAQLLNDEYAFTEVPPGTVVISGLAKMYYGTAVMSAAAAINQATQKENERARFEAEAGKVYYFKWTAGTMATMIKVTPESADVGAKEMRKLHLAKPIEEKKEAKAGAEPVKAEESAKPAEPAKVEESAKPAEAPKTEQAAKPN